MNDIVGYDLITDLRHKRQINGGNEKINRMTGDLEPVLVNDFISGASQDGVNEKTFFVTTIEDF